MFLAMAILDRYRLAHTDFHSGNVLFRKYSDDPDSAFVYHMKSMSVAVRHQSHLFIVWDIANLQQRGKRDRFRKDVERVGVFSDLANFFGWLESYFSVLVLNEDTGVNEPNPNPDPAFKNFFADLSEFCLDMFADHKKVDLARLFRADIPQIAEAHGLREAWDEVVQIDTAVESVTETFNLSEML
jgi:hypothetical protein